MGDQRKYIVHRRVPRRQFFRKIGLLSKGVYEISQSFEVGERGMLIASSTPLNKDDLVVISFNIPGLLSTVVRGIVRYSLEDSQGYHKMKIGVEFQESDFDIKRKIRNYVASREDEALIVGDN
ncbi:MAG: hypothetical protein HOO06_01425 [Bdellovibrionaceae bacterium]|jgi:hypothetical protein|nr:hypothetical protein [Pseudobdellovibrionaceae bacterium]